MGRYEIYRTIKVDGKLLDTLIAVVFNEEDAHTTVQAFRKALGNQTVYFKQAQ